ncbi:serine protease inhibitor Cvsi-2-like [Saccostrea cucullata]|uniref:serine protease inhibitor Cvsi-2-like n=1 Tax=Saccostrea cuccullata TaxID=36930 RepID=UPI002ED40377
MNLFLLLCCALVGYAWCETCTTPDSCTTTHCDEFSHVVCSQGTCTCELREGRCDSKADCEAMVNWFCPLHRRHCVDNRCRCVNL